MTNELDGPTEPGTSPNENRRRQPTKREAAEMINTTTRTVPLEPLPASVRIPNPYKANRGRKRKKEND